MAFSFLILSSCNKLPPSEPISDTLDCCLSIFSPFFCTVRDAEKEKHLGAKGPDTWEATSHFLSVSALKGHSTKGRQSCICREKIVAVGFRSLKLPMQPVPLFSQLHTQFRLLTTLVFVQVKFLLFLGKTSVDCMKLSYTESDHQYTKVNIVYGTSSPEMQVNNVYYLILSIADAGDCTYQ